MAMSQSHSISFVSSHRAMLTEWLLAAHTPVAYPVAYSGLSMLAIMLVGSLMLVEWLVGGEFVSVSLGV